MMIQARRKKWTPFAIMLRAVMREYGLSIGEVAQMTGRTERSINFWRCRQVPSRAGFRDIVAAFPERAKELERAYEETLAPNLTAEIKTLRNMIDRMQKYIDDQLSSSS